MAKKSEALTIRESIQRQLRSVRQARRFSLEALSEKMRELYGASISPGMLSKYEAGHAVIRLDHAVAMAFVLRVPLAQLVLDEGATLSTDDLSIGPLGEASRWAIWQRLTGHVAPDHALADHDLVTWLTVPEPEEEDNAWLTAPDPEEEN